MLAAERGVERLHNTVRSVRQRKERAQPSEAVDRPEVDMLVPYRDRFLDAMNDDFNTPRAIAALFDLNRDVNEVLNSGTPLGRATLDAIDEIYRQLGGEVLGIVPDDLVDEVSGELLDGLVEIILDIREQYRREQNWEEADALRERLARLGIVVDDRPEGPIWRVEHGSA